MCTRTEAVPCPCDRHTFHSSSLVYPERGALALSLSLSTPWDCLKLGHQTIWWCIIDFPYFYHWNRPFGSIYSHHFQTQPHEFDSRRQVVSMGERYAFGVDEPWKAWVAYAKAGWDTITRQTLAPTPTGQWANNVTCPGILSNDGTATCTMSLMQTKHLACPTLVTAVFQMVPQPLKFEHCSKRLLVEDCMGFYQFYYQFYYQYWGLSESILGAAGFAAHLCSFEGIELFDCKFFDISPAEARGSGHGLFFHPSEWVEHVEHVAGMDPTQRQVLEARDHSAFNSSLNFLHWLKLCWDAPWISAHANLSDLTADEFRMETCWSDCGKSANEPSIYKRKNPRSKKIRRRIRQGQQTGWTVQLLISRIGPTAISRHKIKRSIYLYYPCHQGAFVFRFRHGQPA